MKKFFSCITALIIIVTCWNVFMITIFSETSEKQKVEESVQPISKIPSNAIVEPAENIDSIIAKKVTEEVVAEEYNLFWMDKPVQYTYDSNSYILEYNVSTDFWSDVKVWEDFERSTNLNSDYPTIYIPLFGNITDTNGKESSRVIGYVKLYYSWIEKDYVFHMSLYNLTSEEYRNMKVIPFLEKITNYLAQSKNDIQQIFLIRYPSSLTDGQETVAVARSQANVSVLDLSNSLRLNSDSPLSQRSNVYTVLEYRNLRMKVEKNVYKSVDGWENNPAGGSTNSSESNLKNVKIFSCFIIVAMILISIFIFIVRKHKFRKHSG